MTRADTAAQDVDPVRRLSPDLLKQLRAEIRRHYTNLQRQLEETYEEWSESVSRGVFGIPGQHDADGTNVTASATEDSGDTTELSSCGSTVAASSAMTYDADRLLLLGSDDCHPSRDRIVLIWSTREQNDYS